jgi:hypothetical protein
MHCPSADTLQFPTTTDSVSAGDSVRRPCTPQLGGGGAGGGGAGLPLHHASIAETSHPAGFSFAAFALAHMPQFTGLLRCLPHSVCSATVQVVVGGADVAAELAAIMAPVHRESIFVHR